MKKHKWFLVFFIIIIALVVVGYLIKDSNKTFLPNRIVDVVDTSTNLDDFTKSIIEKKEVILLIEDDIKDYLKEEIDVWSNDLKREFDFTVTVRPVSSKETIIDLKRYVANKEKQGDLQGVLIVGDVPTGNLYHPDVPSGSVFNSEGFSQSDSIYKDVDGVCKYSESLNAFSYKGIACQDVVGLSSFWVSRLTPNSSTKDSATLLKDYFKRNHAYRTGQFEYEKNVLIYTPVLTDYERGDVLDEVEKFKKWSLIKSPDSSHVNFVDIDDVNSDELYLSELRKSHKYEIAFYNGHGSPNVHQKDVRPENIQNSSSFIHNFASCSVGRFTKLDYLVGEYLFSDTLFAIAPSVPVISGLTPRTNLYVALEGGLPVFAALKASVSEGGIDPGNFFGDQTLRMRYKKEIFSRRPEIFVERTPISLSMEATSTPITIRNDGNTKLYFQIVRRIKIGGDYSGIDSGLKNQPIVNLTHLIDAVFNSERLVYSAEPNTEGVIIFQTFGDFERAPLGIHSGSVFIISNDPLRPIIDIPYEVKF